MIRNKQSVIKLDLINLLKMNNVEMLIKEGRYKDVLLFLEKERESEEGEEGGGQDDLEELG